MKIRALVIAFFFLFSTSLAQKQTSDLDGTKWIGNVMTEIQTIQVGMTRADIRKVFVEEGGLSTTIWRTYIYHACPNIKVDFEFAPLGPRVKDADGQFRQRESESDVITKISRPYLALSIVD
jgi:hypothetical protein